MFSFSSNFCAGFSRLGEKHDGFLITKESAVKQVDEITQERVQNRKNNGPQGTRPPSDGMAEERAPRAGVSRSQEVGGARRGSLRREMECHGFG